MLLVAGTCGHVSACTLLSGCARVFWWQGVHGGRGQRFGGLQGACARACVHARVRERARARLSARLSARVRAHVYAHMWVQVRV